MSKKFETPAACECRHLIQFLNAKAINTIEIHCLIFNIYEEDAMSDSMISRWIWLFCLIRSRVRDVGCLHKTLQWLMAPHSHTTTATQHILTKFGCQQFDLLPYKPNLTPSEYHLFKHGKCCVNKPLIHGSNYRREFLWQRYTCLLYTSRCV